MYEPLLKWKGQEIKFKRPENPLTDDQIRNALGILFIILGLFAGFVTACMAIEKSFPKG